MPRPEVYPPPGSAEVYPPPLRRQGLDPASSLVRVAPPTRRLSESVLTPGPRAAVAPPARRLFGSVLTPGPRAASAAPLTRSLFVLKPGPQATSTRPVVLSPPKPKPVAKPAVSTKEPAEPVLRQEEPERPCTRAGRKKLNRLVKSLKNGAIDIFEQEHQRKKTPDRATKELLWLRRVTELYVRNGTIPGEEGLALRNYFRLRAPYQESLETYPDIGRSQREKTPAQGLSSFRKRNYSLNRRNDDDGGAHLYWAGGLEPLPTPLRQGQAGQQGAKGERASGEPPLARPGGGEATFRFQSRFPPQGHLRGSTRNHRSTSPTAKRRRTSNDEAPEREPKKAHQEKTLG